MRPALFTRGLSSLSQTTDANSAGSVSSPAEQREDAKRAMFSKMRALPTQHYWHVFTDLQSNKNELAKRAASNAPALGAPGPDGGDQFLATLNQLNIKISSVQEFWFYQNNTPLNELLKMRDSIYLFKAGFRPVWEDRRNINGGSWTFRMPKSVGFDFWTQIQLMAIGEQLQACLDEGDQICGVGLSVRFNSHLITIWHRDSSKQKSIDAMLQCVLDEIPPNLKPKPDNYFYKKHSDHAGFKAPPELQAVLDSQKARTAAAAAAAAAAAEGADTMTPASSTASPQQGPKIVEPFPALSQPSDGPKVPTPAIVEVPASDEQ